MKTYILVFLLFLAKDAVSQTDDEKIIQTEFSKINSNKLTDLIPFCKNSMWGFVDKNSGKVIVPARYSSLNFFNPNMLAGTLNNKTEFYVDSTGNVILGRQWPDQEDDIYKTEIFEEKEFVSSKDGFKGFATNSHGELVRVSDIYDRCCFFQIVKIQGKSYLILSKKGKFGIIDSLGNALKGFDFIHQKISRNPYSNQSESVWFFVTRDGQTWSLQNDKGEMRFSNQIPNGSKQSPYTKGKFGIVVFSNHSGSQINSGLFDCYEMKWIIPPQNKLNIVDVGYSSKETLDTEEPLNRSRADIYFCIQEGLNNYYYSDLKGRIYYEQQPKQR